MEGELSSLRDAGVKPTAGDIRCMVYGHLTRYAIGKLRRGWDPARPTAAGVERFATTVLALGQCQPLIDRLAAAGAPHGKGAARPKQLPLFPQDDRDAVSL